MKPKDNTVRVENSQNQNYAQGSSQYSPAPSQDAQSSIAIETQTPQETVSYLSYLEQCSFKCRKLIGFALCATRYTIGLKISRHFFIHQK